MSKSPSIIPGAPSSHGSAKPEAATDSDPRDEEVRDLRAKVAAVARTQAMIEFDPTGRVLAANELFLAAIGYRLSEIVGREHRMFLFPEEAEELAYRRFWRALAAGEAQSGRFRRVHADGREVYLVAHYTPVLDATGRVSKVIKFATDVSAQVEQERVNERFASMAENSPMGMMFADNAGVIRYVNDAARRVLKALERHLPVRVDAVVGTSMDAFHRSPAHQRALLSRITDQPGQAKLQIGSEWIELTYSAVYDARGQRLGSMSTWKLVSEREALRADLAGHVQTLTRESESLLGISSTMHEDAESTTQQTSTVSRAAGEVTKAVSSVAAAPEEMSATVREIARNAAEAAKVAQAAVHSAEQTNKTVAELGDNSREIGKVVKTITSIAQQTNLLALNATIEAARAGESGKGFAVVANEVKELAKQTAAATEDISRKIEAIQASTQGAVEAIRRIGEIIDQISEFQNTIASAVEEQAATTNEIARAAGEAASSGVSIGSGISTVEATAASTSQGAAKAAGSARALSDLSRRLEAALAALDSSLS